MKTIRIICLFFFSSFYSCYVPGRRQPDLGIDIPVTVNSYYVADYLRLKFMKPVYGDPLNSELVNYPNDFIPLTDSLNKLVYVIEIRVNGDSLKNDGWGLILSSIWDFKRGWITKRDNLKNNELPKFKRFFEDSILTKEIKLYKSKLPDNLLFIKNSNRIEVKPTLE